MIVFTFKTKPLFDKASEALKKAIDTMGSSHFDHSVQPSERTITVIKNKDADIIEGFLKKEGITEFDKREDHSWAPVSAVLKKCAEQCKAFLPSQGYESLMKVRRTEHTSGPGKEKTDLGKPGDPEPIKPGEIVEIYENGKWVKVKWPGVN